MIDTLKTILITLGCSFVNFISTKVYNLITGSYKTFFWKNKYPKLKKIRSNRDFEELKKRTRLLVIDDEDSFPISIFQSEGYSIEKWDTVKDFGKLESGLYDIIILDIKGVANHLSEDDGLGVLESLKKNNPAQIIIAYSQHSFDLSKSKFWELADDTIAKPSDYLKMKTIINNLINIQFKPERYIDCLQTVLKSNRIHEKDQRRLEIEIAKLIRSNSSPNWGTLLIFAKNDIELYNSLKTIITTILNFYR